MSEALEIYLELIQANIAALQEVTRKILQSDYYIPYFSSIKSPRQHKSKHIRIFYKVVYQQYLFQIKWEGNGETCHVALPSLSIPTQTFPTAEFKMPMAKQWINGHILVINYGPQILHLDVLKKSLDSFFL